MLDQAAPDFTLPATGNQTITLSALQGHKVVLYFYPKDSTPGCTTESQQFRDLHADFARIVDGLFGCRNILAVARSLHPIDVRVG